MKREIDMAKVHSELKKTMNPPENPNLTLVANSGKTITILPNWWIERNKT